MGRCTGKGLQFKSVHCLVSVHLAVQCQLLADDLMLSGEASEERLVGDLEDATIAVEDMIHSELQGPIAEHKVAMIAIRKRLSAIFVKRLWLLASCAALIG